MLKFGISPFPPSAAEERFKSCLAIVCATGDSCAAPFLCVTNLTLNAPSIHRTSFVANLLCRVLYECFVSSLWTLLNDVK